MSPGAAPSRPASRPQRWDVPYGPDMTEADVDRVLSMTPFADIDPAPFPPSTPLRGILRNDTRVVRCRAGDLVVRQGDYGNSAFFVLAGAARVLLDPLPPHLLGRKRRARRTVFGALAQLWRNPEPPEVRAAPDRPTTPPLGTRRGEGEDARVFLPDVPAVLRDYRTVVRGTGSFFGELAVIGRSPRTATVFTEGDAELLEIRWQGLRDLLRRAPGIRAHVDRLYRERALRVELSETPLFRHLEDAALQALADQVVYETHGSADWYLAFEGRQAEGLDDRFADEPVIAEEGSDPDGLLLVRAGFVRLTRRVGAGERTVGYLRHGDVYGLEELTGGRDRDRTPRLRHTLRALGSVDLLRVPLRVAAEHLPASFAAPVTARPARGLDTPFLEFLGERRIVNGTAVMVIDLERCARCDECVCACAAGHGNNPRFVRTGPRFGRFLIAGACMHCVDPVCLIGCPTGAIHRSEEGGEVVVNDETCIGCSTCAESCPYENIRMVEVRELGGGFVLDPESLAPILRSTKCDLCFEQLGGPACRRACPHDALERLDPRDLDAFAAWTRR